MPRQARIDALGALHHIMARGIERRNIFTDDRDRAGFVERLGSILEETGTSCYAWALIPNHFHLLLKTGREPVAHVMRRLLTGHAVNFNKRHGRHGHLFQNRYKSILCQEDAYFLELIRYIHLNPLRAGLVTDLNELAAYPFSGHSVLMGAFSCAWQSIEDVLSHFHERIGEARERYRAFVFEGVDQGRRSDLVGGGLIRSAGGWQAVKALQSAAVHGKSDERILGDSDFVTETLEKSQHAIAKRYVLKARGVDLGFAVARVAELFGLGSEEVWSPGRARLRVQARSLLCYWAVRELGESMTAMARRLNVSTPAVSKAVARGAEIAKREGFELVEKVHKLRASP